MANLWRRDGDNGFGMKQRKCRDPAGGGGRRTECSLSDGGRLDRHL